MTLMQWFRDYVYIPLGGSRNGLWITCRNIMFVFFLSGLWHGASLKFIVWGALWGIIMVLARGWGYWNTRMHIGPMKSVPVALKVLLLWYLLTLTFLFFRFEPSVAIGVLRNIWVYGLLIVVLLSSVVIIFNRLSPFYIVIVLTVLSLAGIVYAVNVITLGYFLYILVKLVFPISVLTVAIIEGIICFRPSLYIRLKSQSNGMVRVIGYWVLILLVVLSNDTGQNFIYYQF